MSDDIFDEPPMPEEKLVEARLLARLMHDFIWLKVRNRDGTQPYNPKRRYGTLDMDRDWSRVPPEEQKWWIEAAIEGLQKLRGETL